MIFRKSVVVVMAFALVASYRLAADDSSETINFQGRTINVSQFLEGFPYDEWRWVGGLVSKKLVYLRQNPGKTELYEVPLSDNGSPPSELRNGKVISNIDFTTQKSFRMKIRKKDGNVFFSADQDNNEQFNLYRVNPKTREHKKLTDIHYMAGYELSPDETKIAYVARLGDEGARCEVHVLDLKTGKDRTVVGDDEHVQFTWSTVSWRPDGSAVIINSIKDGDRNHGNLVMVSLNEKGAKPIVLTDPEKKRLFPSSVEKWLNNDEFLYISNDDGYENIYRINVTNRESKQVTHLKRDISDAKLTQLGEKTMLVTLVAGYKTSVISVYDPYSGKKAHQEYKVSKNIQLLDVQGDIALIREYGAEQPFKVKSISLIDPQGTASTRVTLAKEIEREIVHCKLRQVTYDTFDDVDVVLDGIPLQGKLHANIYVPKNPLPKDKALVLTQAFYGGKNRFEIRQHILCAAGIYVFSPAPRGSSGLGTDFETMNDGDLGGKEIIDVIFGGKYISEELDMPPARIGAFGMSHGGYATMRLLTFPGQVEVKGERLHAQFDWGFGISEAGFSSIRVQYEKGNIKNWITKEAGELKKSEVEEEVFKHYESRSPVNFAKHLSGKLLMLHGETDKRVPYEASKMLYDKLVELGKEDLVTLETFEGQGHGFVGKENQLRVYRTWFEFLNKVVEGN